MAGNSKKRRKPTPKGIGTPQRMLERFQTGLDERRKRKGAVMQRNMRLSNLPMGHPTNAHVLSWTFSPIFKMLDDNEKTGTHMVGDDGVAVMWVERDQCYTGIVEACFELHDQFSATAHDHGWGDVPPGLLSYGALLARGAVLTVQDIADARAAVQWMRNHLAQITCFDWVASMNKMQAESTAGVK